MNATQANLRIAFFDYLFEEREGFVCIAHGKAKNKNDFHQKFFNWPTDKWAVGAHIEELVKGHNLWFGINQFRRPERKRDFALPTNLVWADLDHCNPGEVIPPPQCRLETSHNRYQGIWRLEEILDPLDAQALSKRIAYAYADKGADKSGWDIEQLLRVPYTHNYKYDNGTVYVPEVKILLASEALLPVGVFDSKSAPPLTQEEVVAEEEGIPNIKEFNLANVIAKYQSELRGSAFTDLFASEPASDWSSAMWHLINVCLEAGMSKEEAYVVVSQSKCNKYERDKRPLVYLWREVIKADLKQKTFHLAIEQTTPLRMPPLYGGEPPPSIIDKYKDWAKEATDAPEEYHELACTIVLSALLSSGLHAKMSFGKVVPNLWGLILGESTYTRKTTAMKMAMGFISEIEREMVVASEGSVEGLLQGLSGRPGLSSIYYRDEVAGLMEGMARKDYLADMPTTLAHLYDVPEYLPRRLRKETIIVSNAVFIFFGGGIRERVYSSLNDSHVTSGFLPRFLVVSGDTEVQAIRPTARAMPDLTLKRQLLADSFQHMHNLYTQQSVSEIGDGVQIMLPVNVEAELTDDALQFFNKVELQLAEAAIQSPQSAIAQPTFNRLAWSFFKMAVLLAAARQEPTDESKIKVGLTDFQAAAYYIQKWGRHSIDLMMNVGKTHNQRLVQKVLQHIQRRPGCARSELSRFYHLSKRELDLVIETLMDRGQIRPEKAGRGATYYPI